MTTRSVEIKLSFERYDCTPSYTEWCTFENRLLGHGGTSDDHGWSYSDVFQGMDDGGANGNALPAVPANADERAGIRLRRKRLKGSHSYLIAHLSNKFWVDKLSAPPYLGNGEQAFAELKLHCRVTPDVVDTQDLQQEWRTVTIAKDVGSTENTILELSNLLDAKNSLIPAAQQFTDEDTAERILRCIAATSRLFAESATRELNAIEGNPGQPGVRQYQGPLPAGGGPRPRDRAAMVAYYHSQWRAAYRSGAITKVAATKLKPGSSHAVDRGMSILQTMSESTSDEISPPHALRPSESLRAASEAGFHLQRGTCTTSNFGDTTESDLHAAMNAAEDGCESEVGFSVETCYDADDVTSIELLCNNCRGPGHMARTCPSPKKYRSYAYVAELNLRALQRVETRARDRNGPPNGNRPLPRGQKPPFRRGIPKKFQDMHPFRRLGGYPQSVQSGRTAEELRTHTELTSAPYEPPAQPPTPSASEFSRSAILARESLPPGLDMPLRFIVPSEAEDDIGAQVAESGRQVYVEAPAPLLDKAGALPEDEREHREDDRTHQAYASVAAKTTVGVGGAALLYYCRGSLVEAVRSCVQYVQHAVHLAGGALTGAPVAVLVILLLAGFVTSNDAVGADPTSERAWELTTWTPSGWTTTAIGNQVSTAKRHEVSFCVDSGATCICIPAQERWLLSEVGDPNPSIKLVVANGAPLDVECVGMINGPGNGPRMVVEGRRFREEDGTWGPVERLTPLLSRVLAVKGLAPNTRLAGVQPLKADGIYSYFNADNRAHTENCVQLPSGHYVRFRSARECNIVFEVRPLDCGMKGMLRNPNCAPHGPPSGGGPATSAGRTALSTHAGLMHASSARVRSSNITVRGIDTANLGISVSDCRGCQRCRPAPPFLSSSAPSSGVAQRSTPSRNSTRSPSTTNYTFFGQRVDTDICTNLPASWPHGFVSMVNFCDRHTAEWFVYFMTASSAHEVDGCMGEFESRVRTRLREGKIWTWHIDNDLALTKASRQEAAQDLIVAVSRRIPHLSNSNPVAERLWRTLEETVRRTTAFAGDAPLCLWPWIVSQAEQIAYFLTTRAHNPATSPFRFSYPDAPPADLSWAEPLFCDVVVHLPKPDVDGKLAYTSTVGCYLGHDFRRNAQIVYCPEQHRIGHFVVDTWLRDRFDACKGIAHDTPVQYREPDDLRYSTASSVPSAISVYGRNATSSGDNSAECESARRIEADVAALDSQPEPTVVAECARVYRTEQGREINPPDSRAYFEVEFVGSEAAKAVVKENTTLVKIDSVTAARRSAHWRLIKEAMESEIQGKVANEFATPVPYTGQRLMKTKWVILVHLAADGRVVKVKARLVACGYSQIRGVDYGSTSAPTLPGTCYRLFTCICAVEDLDTDHIDAVKAFTQSMVDRLLFTAMPEGFEIPGYVLQLHKALEGIKQGAHLWFEKNKWAWERCGCKADPAEPNLYTHDKIRLIIAVFADDVAAGFKAADTTAYLAIRATYAKLIHIDSPSPDTVVALTDFVGTEWQRDRQRRTIKVTQRKYFYKLSQRYSGKYTLNDMPYKATKTGREAIENVGTDEVPEGELCDKAEYLEALGSIGWPACMTRPELAYIYSKLGGVSMAPSRRHFEYAMHVVGYLINTMDIGPTYGGRLCVPPGVDNAPPQFFENCGLYAVSDSSFGRSARPHGGHVVMRGNAAILWSSKKFKTIVPDSTAEAETLEGSRATKAVMFVKNVLEGIDRPAVGAVALFCDNQAMFMLVQSNVVSQRTRHFERAATLVRWATLRLLVRPYLVSTDRMIADVFTKAVEQDVFQRFRGFLLNAERDATILTKIYQLLAKWM